MSAFLVSDISEKYLHADDFEKFFDAPDRKILQNIELNQGKELPGLPCTNNLFFGFFLDGTKNNYKKADINFAHSNVARLYDACPA